MALFPKSADATRIGLLLLNRRLIRIVVAAVSFLLAVLLLLRHRRHGARFLSHHDDADIMLAPASNRNPEFYPYTTFSDFNPVSLDPSGKSIHELCASFPRHLLNLVQPVLKMGHAEDRAKIEAQLDSVSACFGADEILIFSDFNEKIRNYRVVDILADLPQPYYNTSENPDIRHYLWEKEARQNGTLNKDKGGTKRTGWTLDKFKFLPMVERAWLLKPNKPFYFFYETDTHVFWDNVFRFLQTLNPDEPIYLGSPSPGRHDHVRDIKTWFANGGPGYVLSRAAVEILVHRESSPHGQYIGPSLTEKWLPLLKDECCGDSVVGWALWSAGVELQGYWPMFNPHPMHGIPFSNRYWCQPVLTLHKTAPKDMIDVWRWEFGQRRHARPLLYSDLWQFHHPGHPSVRENWDSGNWDSWSIPPEAGVDSFEECEEQCKKEKRCLQWNWKGRGEKKCLLMRSIQYGVAREPEQILQDEDPLRDKDEKWVDYKSGWFEDRIEKWRNERQCEVVEWVGPSITRVF